MRSPLRCLQLLPFALLLASCGGGGDSGGTVTPPPPPPPPPAAVATVELSRDTATLVSQQTFQVTATTKSSNGTILTGRPVTWQSSAATTASVSSDGLVTGLTAGAAVITATSEGKSASATFTVHEGALIGPAGGVIVSNSGNATLTIPPGALPTPVPITIEPLASPPSPNDLVAGTSYAVGPGGTTFAQPITITIKYPQLAGIDTAQAFYRLSKFENGAWVPLPDNTGGRPGSVVTATMSSIPSPPASRVIGGPAATHGGSIITVGTVAISHQVGGLGWSGRLVLAPTPNGVFFTQSFTVSATPEALFAGQPFTPVSTRWDAAHGLEVTGSTLTASVKGTQPGGPYSYSVRSESPYVCPAPIRCFIGWTGGGLAPTDLNDPRYVYVDQILIPFTGSATVVVGLIPVVSIAVTPAAPSLAPGQKATLSAILKDIGGATLSPEFRTVIWASSDASVASVAQTGEVTAISPGTALISASAEGKTGSTTVTVSVPNTNIDNILVLPSSNGEVELGNTLALQVWPYDAANKPILGLPVTYTTLDPSKATVNSSGIVSGVGLGQVGIGVLVDGVQVGTYVTVVPPYPAAPGSPSAGLAHACLLRDGGSIWCWGDGTYGARGDGSNTPTQQTPVQVSGGNFTALSAGGHRTCALNSIGEAFCWGENPYGQLGDGSTTNKSTPVAVAGGKTFAKIYAARMGGVAAIAGFGCGLEAGGKAWCWGYGSFNGATRVMQTTPVEVTSVPGFTELAIASQSACGLTVAGQAVCFGAPGQPTQPATGHTFTSLAAGFDHFCGLKANGEVWCWGTNTFGQLGDGSTTTRTSPVKVASSVPFTKLTAATDNTCALAQDQTAWCWGIHGRNGDGTPPRGAQGVQAQSTPVPVHGGRHFTEISGSNFFCARAADGTWCWGAFNFGGELGGPYRNNTPVKVRFP